MHKTQILLTAVLRLGNGFHYSEFSRLWKVSTKSKTFFDQECINISALKFSGEMMSSVKNSLSVKKSLLMIGHWGSCENLNSRKIQIKNRSVCVWVSRWEKQFTLYTENRWCWLISGVGGWWKADILILLRFSFANASQICRRSR